MTYYILCNTFRQAVFVASEFAKLYGKEKGFVLHRRIQVTVDDNTFVFLNSNDLRSIRGIHSNIIPFETFRKKYLTPNSQTP